MFKLKEFLADSEKLIIPWNLSGVKEQKDRVHYHLEQF